MAEATSSRKNKKKKDTKSHASLERPQPFWLFPQNHREVKQEQSTNEDHERERRVALDYLKTQVNNTPIKWAPEELLVSIGVFLGSHGFQSTSAVFALERTARQAQTQPLVELEGTRSIPNLLNVYQEWVSNTEAEQKSATSTSGSSDDSDSDSSSNSDSQTSNANHKSIPHDIKTGRRVMQRSDSSESDSNASFERPRPPAKNGMESTVYSGSKPAVSRSNLDQTSASTTALTDASNEVSSNSTDNEESVSEKDTSESDSESTSSSDNDTANPSIAKALDRDSKDSKPHVDHSDSSTTLKASSPVQNSKLDEISSLPASSVSSTSEESSLEIAPSKQADSILGKRKLEATKHATHEPAVKRASKGPNAPFQRTPSDVKLDPRLASNAYVPYDYADKAHKDLIVTKGKGFTKEKNKKKRGSYRGGAIDITGGKSFKFED